MSLRRRAALALALVAGLATPVAAAACGVDDDCPVTDAEGRILGGYRYRAPAAGAEGAARPALIFIHGWRDNAANVMRNQTLAELAETRGVVLVAPEGLGQTWSYPGSPSSYRDEFAFFEALRADLVAHRGVDPDRILVGGFSMGASMAWNLACSRGQGYWGFVTLAGAFWGAIPERCASPPRRLSHYHGLADEVVPIEGRPIAGTRQSDVWDSLAALARDMKLTRRRPEAARAGMTCARWDAPAEATAAPAAPQAPQAAADDEDQLAAAPLSFCRHDGAHTWRPEWLRPALDALSHG